MISHSHKTMTEEMLIRLYKYNRACCIPIDWFEASTLVLKGFYWPGVVSGLQVLQVSCLQVSALLVPEERSKPQIHSVYGMLVGEE